MIDRVVYLLGYTQEGSHTNWYPWYRFYRVFKHLGVNVKWVEKEDIGNEENRIRDETRRDETKDVLCSLRDDKTRYYHIIRQEKRTSF